VTYSPVRRGYVCTACGDEWATIDEFEASDHWQTGCPNYPSAPTYLDGDFRRFGW
jgi:hypothetical protein